MNYELLSVVDENDQVINTLPRHEVHALGLRHRAVHILVFNQQGQLFLQKRSMKKDLNKGLWDTSAAGHVDAGEDYTTTAIRESEEELGIHIKDSLQSLFKLSPTPQLGMEFIHVYQCSHNGPFKLNSEEIDEGTWFSTEAVSKRVINNDPSLTETFKTIWCQYSAKK
ncbi:MAG: NUDIX hydrolase [Methylococcaceae bacterium]